jgi:hypothetical protein
MNMNLIERFTGRRKDRLAGAQATLEKALADGKLEDAEIDLVNGALSPGEIQQRIATAQAIASKKKLAAELPRRVRDHSEATAESAKASARVEELKNALAISEKNLVGALARVAAAAERRHHATVAARELGIGPRPVGYVLRPPDHSAHSRQLMRFQNERLTRARDPGQIDSDETKAEDQFEEQVKRFLEIEGRLKAIGADPTTVFKWEGVVPPGGLKWGLPQCDIRPAPTQSRREVEELLAAIAAADSKARARSAPQVAAPSAELAEAS